MDLHGWPIDAGIERPADFLELGLRVGAVGGGDVLAGGHSHGDVVEIVRGGAIDEANQVRDLAARVGEGADNAAGYGDDIVGLEPHAMLASVAPNDVERAVERHEVLIGVVVRVQMRSLSGRAFDDGDRQAQVIGDRRRGGKRAALPRRRHQQPQLFADSRW